MLSCQNLTLEFNNKIVFKNLGFSLVPGSIMILRGGNGSGKTSLLKIIAGLLTVTQGNVLWKSGGEMHAKCPYALNYVGHKSAVKATESVIDHLIFWCNLYGTPELLMAAISYFKLGEVADELCGTLSAGMQRRLSLARLVCCFSHVWLLDEPDSHLDLEAKKLLYGLIDVRLSGGGVVIMASHEEPAFQSCVLEMGDFAHV
jgi:heme exporter protein A